MDENGETGERLWPTFPATAGLSAREQRDRERERRIHAHVSRHRDRGTRPPRQVRGLTLDEIVATATAVADAEGTQALSMRRIARELGVGTMSLYWYIASKEELLDLMLEAFEAEVQVPEPSGDWRADVRTVAHRHRAALLRHQWALELRAFRPPSGPNDARNADRMFAILYGLGLGAKLMVTITTTVGTYVIGAVLREIGEIRLQRETEQAIAGMTAEEVAALHEDFIKRIVGSGKYPHLARIGEEGIDPDSPDTRDERFDFGLDCLIDGIAARLPSS
jgi:AcrR family transcriptional regulator